MKSFHRLPNGSWIDLRTVTDLQPIDGPEGRHGPRVVLAGREGFCVALPFDTLEQAQKFADELGAQIQGLGTLGMANTSFKS